MRKKPAPIVLGDTLTGVIRPAVGHLMDLDAEDDWRAEGPPPTNSLEGASATPGTLKATPNPIQAHSPTSPTESDLALAVQTLAPSSTDDEMTHISKCTAGKLVVLMRGILERSVALQGWFDSQKNNDHKQFCKALLTESHRHDRAVNELLSKRHYQLKDQGLQLADAFNEINKLNLAVAQMADDLDIPYQPAAN
ncbi:hypothetical protein PGTUg99_019300 [Puccinia graminis f. sp. tritici]|nr:hypothetical protein PGTUg99_019300 [Puccinia graminis f. sp. tritici]